MHSEMQVLVENIEARQPLDGGNPAEKFRVAIGSGNRELYRNRNDKLGIDFSVEVLEFPGIQAFDPRIVRVAPGANNELHKHAHESLFYVISGRAEVRIGDGTLTLEPGAVAFVPRWAFHQSRNLSDSEELVILAITDFGLTSAVLGNYDKRTRLAEQGADVKEQA